MTTRVTITIPEPCNENWSAMKTVDELHRHCNRCDKVLTDFTAMSETELVLWLKHSKGKVCGRFSKQQLNKTVVLPEKARKRKLTWNSFWLLPLGFFTISAYAQKTPFAATVLKETSEGNSTITEQGWELNGYVRNAENNSGLHRVQVSIKKPGGHILFYTHTDSSGFYKMQLPDSLKSIETEIVFYSPAGEMIIVPLTGKEEIKRQKCLNVLMKQPEPAVVRTITAEDLITRGVTFDQAVSEHVAGQFSASFSFSEIDNRSFWSKLRLGFGFWKNP